MHPLNCMIGKYQLPPVNAPLIVTDSFRLYKSFDITIEVTGLSLHLAEYNSVKSQSHFMVKPLTLFILN